MPSADVQLQVFDTDEATWRALTRVFVMHESGAHRWVSFRTTEDVLVTFFGPDGGERARDVLDAAAQVEEPSGPARTETECDGSSSCGATVHVGGCFAEGAVRPLGTRPRPGRDDLGGAA